MEFIQAFVPAQVIHWVVWTHHHVAPWFGWVLGLLIAVLGPLWFIWVLRRAARELASWFHKTRPQPNNSRSNSPSGMLGGEAWVPISHTESDQQTL